MCDDNREVERVTIVRHGCYEGTPDTIELDLMDTRASDGIRIVYDFDRDGWSILQASRFVYPAETPKEDRDFDWQEVAFVRSWQRASCEDPSLEWANAECGPLCPECSEE